MLMMLWHELPELYHYRELLQNLVLRDIKLQGKQSFLGYLWVIIPPFFSMIVYTLIVSRFLGVQVGTLPYPVFVFCTLLPWNLFVNTLSKCTETLIRHTTLITHVKFPSEILILASIVGELMNAGISSVLLMVLMLAYHVSVSATILFTPCLLLIQLMFTVGLGLLLSALHVYYRDVGYFASMLYRFWMYLSPVIYSLENVPVRYRTLYLLNPMAVIIDGYRCVILEGSLPHNWSLLYVICVAWIMLIVGYTAFKKLERTFADII